MSTTIKMKCQNKNANWNSNCKIILFKIFPKIQLYSYLLRSKWLWNKSDFFFCCKAKTYLNWKANIKVQFSNFPRNDKFGINEQKTFQQKNNQNVFKFIALSKSWSLVILNQFEKMNSIHYEIKFNKMKAGFPKKHLYPPRLQVENK